jgi:hypothetical protein
MQSHKYWHHSHVRRLNNISRRSKFAKLGLVAAADFNCRRCFVGQNENSNFQSALSGSLTSASRLVLLTARIFEFRGKKAHGE